MNLGGRIGAALVFAGLLLAGCALPPDALAAADAGQLADGGSIPGDPELEIGTGFDAFEALPDGATLALTEGPQGGSRYFGFHVWLGLACRGIDPSGIHVRWSVRDPSTGEDLGTAAYTVDLVPLGDRFSAWAMRVTLSDCCAASNRPIELALETTDASGAIARSSRTVMAATCSVCTE